MASKTIKTAKFRGTWGEEAVKVIVRTAGAHKGTHSIYDGGYNPQRAMSADRCISKIEKDRRFIAWTNA